MDFILQRTAQDQCPLSVASGRNSLEKFFSSFWRTFISVLLLFGLFVPQYVGVAEPFAANELVFSQDVISPFTILVDDFKPQHYQGDSVYYYNRLGGDRGALNNSIIAWGDGQVRVTVAPGNSWGGLWESINHPDREGTPVNFSAVLPGEILPAYQSKITGITVRIKGGTVGRTIKLELKEKNKPTPLWSYSTQLNGASQVISRALPALGNINEITLVLDNAVAGNFVEVEKISFTATTQITDTATAAFVWSYGMLLNNWNPNTGLVRDRANFASGEFDAVQATGSLAAATALAEQLDIISQNQASVIVSKIGDTLLNDVPRCHGIWPHFVGVSNGTISIKADTEWSSVDTVIAAIGLLDAQNALGMNTSTTEQMLDMIDWENLAIPGTGISHGYNHDCTARLESAWDTFGGESWLVDLAYTASTDQIAPLASDSQPTANGSGFIDELAWLFVLPPSKPDIWGNNWDDYRADAADAQISYYPKNYPELLLQPAWFIWLICRRGT